MDFRKLRSSAKIVVNQCLGIKNGESVVIVTDKPCKKIGEVLWEELPDKKNSYLVEITPTGGHGKEPPPLIADILRKSDVFIIPTSFSLTHTQARIRATQSGARGATMPGITADVMIRTLNADYHRIARLTKKMERLLTKTSKVLIKTGKNELYLDISSRKGHPDTGIIRTPKSFSNLPAGEAYCAPLEDKSEGKVVIDGSFAPLGLLRKPVILTLRSGKIVKLEGNKKFEKIFDETGEKGRVLCELGIGTNYKAIITGNVLEDEKVMGTIHLAFGNNLGFGGKNDAKIHLDGVIRNPWVWFDNRLVIKQGRILI
jgi:leucyl aminopeptidase (aminopeptidase T)|uniref:Aminopeptidase n=1 Tax=candidate division WOR-3 bacterium TaxID=2052148 RepID=A0A7C6AG07_UNCW3